MAIWGGIEERLCRQLALWKRDYIDKGGRLTLITSTLASLPLYQMSLVRMLVAMARRLETLHRSFLGGGRALVKKAQLVNWETICSEKGQDDLGLIKSDPLEQSPSR